MEVESGAQTIGSVRVRRVPEQFEMGLAARCSAKGGAMQIK